jgi:hypothetical protein
MVVKRMMRYLVLTLNLGLWYPKGSHFVLIGRSLVSWSSKKQNSIILSMTEAEYVTAGSCCSQLL